VRCRVALEGRSEVGAGFGGDLGPKQQGILKGVADQFVGDVGIPQPLRHAADERGLEVGLVEHMGHDHCGKRRLARENALGIGANRIPHWIDLLDLVAWAELGAHEALHRSLPI
jgi:hypothetical protein